MTGMIKKAGSNKIVIRQFNKVNLTLNMTLMVFLLMSVFCILTLDTGNVDFKKALIHFFNDLKNMLLYPKSENLTLFTGFYEVLVTLGLSFLTTLIGAAVALFVGLLAAQNLTNPRVSNVIKGFVALIRAIPTVLWVLIFAIGAGLGSVAAVVGMSFHSIGYLIKAYSESYEEIDHGVIEALKASGASWIQIVFQAVIPSSLSSIFAWTFIRFEINFTTAVAMGAAAAAGGIGFDLFQASSFYFNIREVGFITYMILGIAVILEIIATRLKKN